MDLERGIHSASGGFACAGGKWTKVRAPSEKPAQAGHKQTGVRSEVWKLQTSIRHMKEPVFKRESHIRPEEDMRTHTTLQITLKGGA